MTYSIFKAHSHQGL